MSDILRIFAKNLQAMKRTLLLFVVLVLGVSGLRAQHFEWAKGYSSSQEGNRIVGSVTDSAGNLYILGNFRNDASWDGGSHLLPIAPYGPYTNVHNVLIAKITPDGTMAWKKVLHANNGIGATAWDIKSVGDTAFACLVRVTLPTEEHYSYYLDTLLNGWGDYPIPNGDMGSTDRTALIMFDFEGNVLEQHFLTLTYIDNEGNDFKYGEWYKNNGYLLYISFDIDSEGNIYFCRSAVDAPDGTHSPWQGNISGIKYWVDGRVVGASATDNKPLGWFPQLLKFSPHMDTLLASRYLVQSCDSLEYQTENLYMKLDREGNPYVVGTLSQFGRDSNLFVLDSSRNLFMHHSPANLCFSFLMKIDTAFQIAHNIILEDSVIRPERNISITLFYDIDFDYDSNLIFLTAQSSRTTFSDTSGFYSILMCQGVPLMNMKNSAFILSFSIEGDTLAYHSYSLVDSKYKSEFSLFFTHGNLACKNNRIFSQCSYIGGIRFPGQNITIPFSQNKGLALVVFDYQGRNIGGIDYSSVHINNNPGPICIRDSVLYLTNHLETSASFGDIQLNVFDNSVYIAKYIDTSFMTPYVYTGDTGNVRIVVAEGGTWTSYPNPFRQRVNIEVEDGGLKVERAWLTDLAGRREEVRLQPDGPNRYVLDLTGRPQASYLLTLVTADGQQRTLRLLKQEDMFGE